MSAQAREKSLKMSFKIDDTVPLYFHGDVKRIRQILLNLLSNAVKFTDKGFIITKVSGNALPEDMYELHFAVRDSGIGIAEKDITKIFQSFKQVDSIKTRIYGGTGLGLPICSNLIRLMNGTIWVNSRLRLSHHKLEEAGSTFHFVLRVKQCNSPPNLNEKRRTIVKKK
jgi:signal transduction histidine kinase